MVPPVLCYHRVGGPPELGVTRVSPATFRRQMQALARAGWRALSLADFINAAHTYDALHAFPERDHAPEFLLTFDDGYTELEEYVYPVIRDLDFTATTFVITDYAGQSNSWDIQYTRRPLTHLGWDAIERWKGRGLDFASHTASHSRLTWLEPSRVADELGRSRQTLFEHVGFPAADAVAYPFGAVDDRVADVARAAGYRIGFAGVAGVPGDPLRVSRTPVYVWDVGSIPLGVRDDELGLLGQIIAFGANQAAVGTSVMRRLLGRDASS